MAKTKSKQLANILTFTTASIDVVSGSLIPDAANLYNIGSSTLPYKSGSFQHLASDSSSIGSATTTGNAIVEGDLLVTQYIRHKGDTNTLINFTDNRVRLDAGGVNFLSFEKDASTPYPFTVNNGGNRINFRVVDRNSDLLLKTDSEAFNVNLYHAGNEKLQTNTAGVSVTGSVLLQEQSTTPTAQEGGLMYSGSNFYLGFD
jgi:hypothetical protein